VANGKLISFYNEVIELCERNLKTFDEKNNEEMAGKRCLEWSCIGTTAPRVSGFMCLFHLHVKTIIAWLLNMRRQY